MRGASGWISQVKVRGSAQPYLQFDSAASLAEAAQIAAVELHPWNCQPGNPETPGRLVFDLDPAADVAFGEVVSAAKEVRDRLHALGLESFCKTTGGKGLHVVTPLRSSRSEDLTWALAKAFALAICKVMAADSPERFVVALPKNRRRGKIFLDYLRNDRAATAVAPLSPRARAGAPVAMPLTWAQLRASLDPSRFTIGNAPMLLERSQAWEGYGQAQQSVVAIAKKFLSRPMR
jgi:bifunctional non-homologous end joining protein LigD